MWTRKELKTSAKAAVKKNYWGAVLAAIVASIFSAGNIGSSASKTSQSSQSSDGYSMISTLKSSEILTVIAVILGVLGIILIVQFVVDVLIANPFEVGAARFFIQCEGEEKVSVKEILFAFKHSYGNIVKTMFLRDLFTFLWSLLLIIPGIYKYYQWMMVPYIMADNPDMNAKEARQLSARMMDGNKWNAFVLLLSFIGWILLSALTCGLLAIFYVGPYVQMTYAELYHRLKEETVETAA